MATAFTEQEIEYLRQKAIDVAGRMVQSYGMQKVSLDKIMAEVGASKLTFYKLFETKEHLFLAFFEQFHDALLNEALEVLKDSSELPIKERFARCMMHIARTLDSYQINRFMQEDFPVLLRKIPEARCLKYENHSVDLTRILEVSGAKLNVSVEVGTAIIHTLIFCVFQKKEIAEEEIFWSSYEEIVRGSIDRIVCD